MTIIQTITKYIVFIYLMLNKSSLLRGVDSESRMTKSILGNGSMTQKPKVGTVPFVKNTDQDLS